jgi:ferredoxin
MGAGYVTCRYDPFVGFFRLQRFTAMAIAGGLLLLAGVWIARPFCRFFCPYGVVLGWLSGLSRRPLSICPGECINCGLCVEACPFDAIESPAEAETAASRERHLKRMGVLILLAPVWVLLGGWALSSLHVPLSRAHHRVALAETVLAENAQGVRDMTDRSKYFRTTDETLDSLLADACRIRRGFYVGGWIIGAVAGLALGLRIANWSRRYNGSIHEPNLRRCLSCGRCLAACPVKPETQDAKGAGDA